MKTNKRLENGMAVIWLLVVLLLCTACSGGDTVSSNNLSSGNENASVSPAPITDTGEIVFSEEMMEASVINAGNTYRLAEVMQRASAGEDITIVYLGGSITDGSLANPKESSCYAYLSQQWWEETFPETEFTYVNAGIGATDSYIGVHRVTEDVISHQPDLVIVEFSVNDGRNHNKETYESLLRRLLLSQSEPAVLSLVLTTENGGDYGAEHAAVAFKLGVPILSYSALLSGGMLSWLQVGNSDGVHPDNPGHAVIAAILTGFYRQVYEGREEILASGAYEVPEGTLTLNRYENAELVYSDEMYSEENDTESAETEEDGIGNAVENTAGSTTAAERRVEIVTMDGFSPEMTASPLSNQNGWIATEGGTFIFSAECRALGFVYLETVNGSGGEYEIIVDGVSLQTLDADFPGGWGNYAEYVECVKTTDAALHTVEIRSLPGAEENDLTICAICVAY